MLIQMNNPVCVNVKSVYVTAKVRDEGFYTFKDENGDVVREYEGYVPGFFPGQHHGDYLELDIDLETGKILNWKKVDEGDLGFITDME